MKFEISVSINIFFKKSRCARMRKILFIKSKYIFGYNYHNQGDCIFDQKKGIYGMRKYLFIK